MKHIPVLLQESLAVLDVQKGETVLDCTLNRAGHSLELAKATGKTGTLIGIDLDLDAIKEAKENFEKATFALPKVHIAHSNFRMLDSVIKDAKVHSVDKILFDLGLSSHELDVSGRGFTFQKDEPLLMTFHSKPTKDMVTAYDVVNTWGEETLADIIFGFGDEKYARRIAKAIVNARTLQPIKTTEELVYIIGGAVPVVYRRGKTHFATKTFQAIRMAVNDELGALEEALEKAFNLLSEGGRMAVITFHSGEDRIVKRFFIRKKGSGEAEILTKKPIGPTKEEIQKNIRARSAKLRGIQKI